MSLADLGVFFPSSFLNYYLSIERRNTKKISKKSGFKNSHFLQVFKNYKESDFNKINMTKHNLNPASISQILFPFCRRLNGKNECEKCVRGYSMEFSKGVCKKQLVKYLKHCVIFKSKNECEVCQKGFYLSRGKCIARQVFEEDLVNSQTVNRLSNQVDTMFVKKKQQKVKIRPDEGEPAEKEKVKSAQLPVTAKDTKEQNKSQTEENKQKNESEKKEQKDVQVEPKTKKNEETTSKTTTKEIETSKKTQNKKNADKIIKLDNLSVEARPIEAKEKTKKSKPKANENKNSKKQVKSTKNDQNIHLKPIVMQPEESVYYDNFKVLDNDLNPTAFPNFRSYMIKKQYKTKDENDKKKTIDYLISFVNGNISMAFDKNVDKSRGPFIELNEMNISKNCSKIQLKGASAKPLPICLECANYEKYFMKNYSDIETQVKVCVPRKKFLTNCLEYDPHSEACARCAAKHFLFSDDKQQQCLASIPFCEEHELSLSVQCKVCQKGYLRVNRKCEKQEVVKNCKSQQNNICLACENGFVLYKNRCMNQAGYSFFKCPLDSEGRCLCGDDSSEVESVNECVQIQKDNCLEFSDESTCSKCRVGFYLNSSGVCLEGQIAFCREYAELINGTQVCKECRDGYVLENNTCRETIPIFTKNCLEKEGENCLKCSKSSYRLSLYKAPLELQNSYLQVCTKNVFFEAYSNVQNCLIFDTLSKQCQLCKPGLWVLEDGHCGQCDFATSAIDSSNTKCITPEKKLAGCRMYSDEMCIECTESQKPNILAENYVSFRRMYTDRARNKFTERPAFVIQKCGVSLSSSCATDFCENAVELPDGSTCCKKCEFTRFGRWVQKSNIYYTNSCGEIIDYCDGSVKYGGIEMEFEEFLTCHKCIENRLVNMSFVENNPQISCVERPGTVQFQNCLIMVDSSCFICEPKYKKILDESESFVKCQLIENCAASSTVDKCEECEVGFSVDAGGESCVREQLVNCKRVDENLKCVECRDGLVLFREHCFEVDRPDCASFSGGNCVTCKSEDFSGNSLKLLVKLNLQFENQFTNNEKALCVSPSRSKRNPRILNCEEYSSFDFCTKCSDSFIIKQEQKKHVCIADPESTKFCQMLDESGKCIQCRNGMYLESDRCLEGAIRGCKEYQDQLNCSECEPKYALFKLNNRKMCFYNYKIDNCSKSIFSQIPETSKINFDCLKCEDDFRKRSVKLFNPICYPLSYVRNCRQISPQSDSCQQCDDLYFLNGEKKCQKRKHLSIRFCQELDPKADKCLKCAGGYGLQNDDLGCNLGGIVALTGCWIHKDSGSGCLVCDSRYYLDKRDFSCKKVSQEVENCAEYLGDKVCLKCNFGYDLEIVNKAQVCQKQEGLITKEQKSKIGKKNGNHSTAHESKNKKNDKTNSPVNIKERSVAQIQDPFGNPDISNFANDSNKLKLLKNLETSRKEDQASVNASGSLEDEISQSRLLSDESEGEAQFGYRISNSRLQNPFDNFFKQRRLNEKESKTGLTTTKGVCGLCKQGFVFSFESNKCERISIEGCMIRSSQNECKICQSGYYQLDQKVCVKNFEAGLVGTIEKSDVYFFTIALLYLIFII